MFDIAQGDTDDTLYGIKNRDLYRINVDTGNFTLLGVINTPSFNPNNFRVTSLVKESTGVLLGVNQTTNGELFRINVNSLTATNLGNTGFESAGDLTFFDGDLYLSGLGDELVLIDVLNPSNSSFVGSLASSGIADIFGVVTIITADPCAADPVFELVATGRRNTSFVNPLNGNTTINCSSITNSTIFGAAEVNSDIICSIDLDLLGDGIPDPSFCGTGSPVLSTVVDPVTPIGIYEYEWRERGNATILSTNATYTPTVATTKVYECIITDTGRAAPDNTATATITVTINPVPNWNSIGPIIAHSFYDLPTVTGSNIPTNTAYFTRPNGTGTRFNPGDQVTEATFTTNPTTLYVYGIDPNGCELQEQFTIEFVDVQITISPSGQLTGCEGDTITFTATPDPVMAYGTYTYNWDDGLGNTLPDTSSITVTLTQSATYSVTVNDSGVENGVGMGFDMVMVTVTPSINIDDLLDQSAQNTFTFPNITGSNVSSGARYYTQPGGLGTSYAPGDVVDTSDFTSFPVTIYIYDNNGPCDDEESFLLEIITTGFVVDLSSSDANVCVGESVTLTATMSPVTAIGNYSYSWTTTTDATVLSTAATLTTAVNTATTYICTVIDDGINGSNGMVSQTITVNVTPVIIIDGLANVTVDNSFIFPPITGAGLTGNVAYFTAPNGGGTRYEAGDIVDRSDFASFPVTIYLFDDNGFCTDTETFDLVIEPIILDVTISTVQMIICEGTAVTLTASVVPTNPVDSYTYEWTSTATTGVIATTVSITVSPDVTTTYSCRITDLGILQTSNNESGAITIFVSPQLVIDTPSDVIADVTFTFPVITGTNLTSDVAYYTQPNGGGTRYDVGDVVDDTDFTVLPVTLYLYDENDACSDETSFILDIITPPLFVDIDTSSDTVCSGEAALLSAQPDPIVPVGTYTYEWRISGTTAIIGTDATLSVSPLTTTVYECTLGDTGLPAGLNEAVETIEVEVIARPDLANVNDVIVDSAYVFPPILGTNLSGNEAYYLEPLGQGTRFLSGDLLEFNANQIYPLDIFIYDANVAGCADSNRFLLTIINPEPELFKVPQFLTPNDDTFNDSWNVIVINDEVIIDLVYIYDRYGKLLKQISVTGNGWDGDFNDNPLPSSSYWYQFTYEYRGDVREQKGYFALKR
jgi:gliding motility-associated-like protein